MKKNLLIFLITCGIIFSGCDILNNRSDIKYNSQSIKNLIVKAIKGDKRSNDLLSGLIDSQLPLTAKYNQLTVDSLNTNNGRLIYFALLTFPNPLYNRFAVYNKNLRAYLIDKSLNGYVEYKIDSTNNKKLIELDENFDSKDVLNIRRLSLYQIFDTTANLVFRNFTELKTPDNDFFQNISEISEYRIKTVIGSSSNSAIFNKSDIFNWDTNSRKYVSFDSLFDKFVFNFIDDFKNNPVRPEITVNKSAMNSTAVDRGVNAVKKHI